MSRNRKSARDAGTKWAQAVADYLKENYNPGVERRVNRGALDQGDISGVPGIAIEAKNVSNLTLAKFVTEATREAHNAGVDIGVVWAHRVGKASPADGYVFMDGATFLRLLSRLPHPPLHPLFPPGGQ